MTYHENYWAFCAIQHLKQILSIILQKHRSPRVMQVAVIVHSLAYSCLRSAALPEPYLEFEIQVITKPPTWVSNSIEPGQICAGRCSAVVRYSLQQSWTKMLSANSPQSLTSRTSDLIPASTPATAVHETRPALSPRIRKPPRCV